MRLGMGIPNRHPDGSPFTAVQVMDRARAIEAAGFDGVWLGENLNRGNIMADPLMTLLLCAAATQRIEVGTAILEVPLRSPGELALRLLSMHALTGGRFVAGLGAGSTQSDFEACGVDFSQRFRLLAEYLPVIRRLCKGERVDNTDLTPWPSVRGGPPLLIGAWASGIWVKRAGRDYDGWLASGRVGFNEFKSLAAGMKVFRSNGGKRALIATVGVDLSGLAAPLREDEAFNLRCSPEEATRRLKIVADIGFDDVLLIAPVSQKEDDLPAIRALWPKE